MAFRRHFFVIKPPIQITSSVETQRKANYFPGWSQIFQLRKSSYLLREQFLSWLRSSLLNMILLCFYSPSVKLSSCEDVCKPLWKKFREKLPEIFLRFICDWVMFPTVRSLMSPPRTKLVKLLVCLSSWSRALAELSEFNSTLGWTTSLILSQPICQKSTLMTNILFDWLGERFFVSMKSNFLGVKPISVV